MPHGRVGTLSCSQSRSLVRSEAKLERFLNKILGYNFWLRTYFNVLTLLICSCCCLFACLFVVIVVVRCWEGVFLWAGEGLLLLSLLLLLFVFLLFIVVVVAKPISDFRIKNNFLKKAAGAEGECSTV